MKMLDGKLALAAAVACLWIGLLYVGPTPWYIVVFGLHLVIKIYISPAADLVTAARSCYSRRYSLYLDGSLAGVGCLCLAWVYIWPTDLTSIIMFGCDFNEVSRELNRGVQQFAIPSWIDIDSLVNVLDDLNRQLPLIWSNTESNGQSLYKCRILILAHHGPHQLWPPTTSLSASFRQRL